jgi:hypothetical protein
VIEMRERVLLVVIALLVLLAVNGRVRQMDRRLAELEEWRAR